MEPGFVVVGIRLAEHLVFVAFPLSQELHNPACVSSLAKIEEGSDFSEAVRCSRSLCLPLEIEVTLLEAFHDFKLVADHPVFFGVLLEVKTEI